jgi:pilus assembly protein Flp/PilA
MLNLYLRLRALLAQEQGQDLAEYALLLALIAIVAVAAVTLLGTNVQAIFNNIAAQLHL